MLEGLQGFAFLLTIVGMVAAAWLTFQQLRRRNAWLEAERKRLEAEIASRDARYREFYHAVDAVTREKAVAQLTRSQPCPNPPLGIAPTLQKLMAHPDMAADPFFVSVGWYQERGVPGIMALSLNPRSEYFTGNIALSGETRYGKGNLAFLILATLCLRCSPRQLQVFAMDPKRDFGLWRGKAHNWREPVLGRDPALIRAALATLRLERERREALRERYRALEHVQIPEAARPPILLVYLAELDVLQLGTDDLDEWLAAEMSTALAAGIIYLIDTQNNTQRKMRWRTHFGTFLAGFQASESSVEPNLGMRVDEIEKLGAIPPNKLPGRGYFTVRNGRDVVTVRAPLIELPAREAVLARMPTATEPREIALPVAPPAGVGVGAASAPAGAMRVEVTPEERARIIAEASRHTSRGDLCAAVFDGRRTGEPFQKVKAVCDAEGLLLPNQSREFREPQAVAGAS